MLTHIVLFKFLLLYNIVCTDLTFYHKQNQICFTNPWLFCFSILLSIISGFASDDDENCDPDYIVQIPIFQIGLGPTNICYILHDNFSCPGPGDNSGNNRKTAEKSQFKPEIGIII